MGDISKNPKADAMGYTGYTIQRSPRDGSTLLLGKPEGNTIEILGAQQTGPQMVEWGINWTPVLLGS
jgi:hypothetical protein